MKVALDTMIFIYLFELHPKYLSQTQLLFERIEKGKLQAVTSFITPLEVFSSPVFEEAADRLALYTRFFQKTPNLTLVQLDWKIVLEAAELRRRHKPLKTPDAIHLATAITHGAEAFITNDERLSRLKLPLKITLLSKYH